MANQQELEQRIIAEAMYVIETGETIRQTAKRFGLSKSTIHEDIRDRLMKIDEMLYKKVREKIEYNISQRAIRGGMATKRKYKK